MSQRRRFARYRKRRRTRVTAEHRQRRLRLEQLEPRHVLSVVISEIMFHPDSGDVGDEYIELLNQGTQAVDLAGWKLNNGVDFTFASGTLGAGQYLVVAANLAEFQANYPTVTNVVGDWSGRLSNSGERVTLVDAADVLVDTVSYADEGDWAFREFGRGRDLVESITRSGTTATVRITDHGYNNGDVIEISGADQPQYNGTFTVSGVVNTNATTFTITVSGSPATPATGHIISRRIDDINHSGWSWTQLADGLGSSLELVNPSLSNDYGQNWSSSTVVGGTPGAANTVASVNIAPLVLDLAQTPVIPTSAESVIVTARLVDELGTASAATLYYRADSTTPPPFSTVTMRDDGLAGDAVAGDGIWIAVIPPHADGTVVEFYVSVTDGVNTRTWPGPTDSLGTQGANALYQVDDTTYSGTQPLFKVIMTEAERAELELIGLGPGLEENTNAAMNGTFVSVDSTGTDVRYTVGIRGRGAGSRDEPPNNFRVNIPTDRLWHDTDNLDFNGRWSTEDVVGHTIFMDAGVPAQFVVPAQVRVNNVDLAAEADYDMFGSYSYLESEGNEYADAHYPLDNGGSYYRGIAAARKADFDYRGEDSDSYRPYYTKETNTEDDWTDLINLTKAFDTVETPDAVFVETIEQAIDLDEWLRFFAVSALIGNEETSLATGRGDDFVMYRGTEDTRFQLIAHDLDTILGQGSSGGSLSASIFRAASDTTNLPSIARLLKFPDIVPRYYAALLEQINTTFAAENLDALIDNAVPHADEAMREAMKTWAASRVAAVLTQIPQALTATSTLSQTGGYYRTTSSTTSLTGYAHAADTRSVLVNGVAATWSAWQATWTASSVSLRPGINRILVQSLDADGVEFERTYIDVWRDTGTTTNVSGTLPTGTTHWTVAGGQYRVTGTLTVPVGATLIIDPGVTVFFNIGVGLVVNGRLQAEGTDLARIRFTKYPGLSGSWQEITFDDTLEENRVAYADIEYAGSGSYNVQMSASRADFDHVVWMNTNKRIINGTGSSISLTNSVTPDTTSIEAIHMTAFPADGYALFQGNTFGKVTGGNDIIDFTGGQRPGPILQILDNVFLGSEDDILDLDGTDAHIEGNVFLSTHLVDPNDADTSSAISSGVASGNASEMTIVRNFFYDLDHAVLVKEGSFATLVNNTIVNVSVAAVNFDEPLRSGIVPGVGAYLDGNIIWDTSLIFENVNSDGTTTDITVNRSILSTATVYPGIGNSNLDPQLVNIADVTDPRVDFVLQPGPGPAGDTGPNGRDMGADVPAGASISGEPLSPTGNTTATLVVGGPDIYAYEYRVNGGAWSGEVTVTDPGTADALVPPIVLAGLTNGSYTVEVIAKNSAGAWQNEAEATASQTWTVDTSLASRAWISEVLAANSNTLNVNGSTPDLIELYNDGPAAIDLAGMAITDRAGERKFTFTPGATIGAGEHLVLYGSGAVSPPGITLNFSLSQDGEGVFLYDTLAHGGGLVDSVVFGAQLTDYSVARRDDGSWGLAAPTFGAANQFAPLGDPHQLTINEWFTSGSGPDFIELYNPSTLPVDLGGLYLTDDPITQPDQHEIAPLYFVEAGGLAVFIADGDPAAGVDHVDFKLAYEHGQLGLFDSSLERIEVVTYGWQQEDQSQGRYPNGDPLFYFFYTPNPNLNNPDPEAGPGTLPLRIVELHYHPADYPGVTDDEDLEFIEVLNTGTVAVNLEGVQITLFSTTPYTFGSGLSLDAGERIVVARDPSVFQSVYGTGVNLAPTGYDPANLSNGGERIALVSATGETLQDFTYGDSNVAGWPDDPDGDGPSLEYIGPLDQDSADPSDPLVYDPYDDPANWQASLVDGGSPGTDGSALPLAGDYDGSGTVDDDDWLQWKSDFGTTVGIPGTGSDGNGNGVVDAADYTVWRDNYGATSPAAGSGLSSLVPTLCVGTDVPSGLSPQERLTSVFPRGAWEQVEGGAWEQDETTASAAIASLVPSLLASRVPTLGVGTGVRLALSPQERLTSVFPRGAWEQVERGAWEQVEGGAREQVEGGAREQVEHGAWRQVEVGTSTDEAVDADADIWEDGTWLDGLSALRSRSCFGGVGLVRRV
jgi:hypothetical protein